MQTTTLGPRCHYSRRPARGVVTSTPMDVIAHHVLDKEPENVRHANRPIPWTPCGHVVREVEDRNRDDARTLRVARLGTRVGHAHTAVLDLLGDRVPRGVGIQRDQVVGAMLRWDRSCCRFPSGSHRRCPIAHRHNHDVVFVLRTAAARQIERLKPARVDRVVRATRSSG